MAVYALYFMLAGKILGTALTFKHGLSLVAWSSMPMLLGMIGALVGVFMMTPQTTLESLLLVNVDPLLMQLPMDSKWSSLAKGFSLLNFWNLFLVALGWRIWGKTGWSQAIIVGLIPLLVVYGGMATFAMLR